MQIKNSWLSQTTGEKVDAFYEDNTDFSILSQEKIKSICAFCFYDGKFVMVNNEGRWEPVAGHTETGESPEESLIREIKEESNMKVLKYFPLGYLYTFGQDIYQTRYFCLVEPYGPFISDPDGGVTEIQLIKPDDFMSFFVQWGESAEYIKKQCLYIIKNIDLDKKL